VERSDMFFDDFQGNELPDFNSNCYERKLFSLFQLHLPIKRYQHSSTKATIL